MTNEWESLEERELNNYSYKVKVSLLNEPIKFWHNYERIIFLGDSLTDFCEWHEFDIPNRIKIYNRGISGDTCSGIMARIDSIRKLYPAKLFLMAGINNLAVSQPVYIASKEYQKLIAEITSFLDGDKVFLLSILPINPDMYHNKHIPNNYNIIRLNEEIKRIAKEFHCGYIDLYNEMIDENGYLKIEYTVDGCHLNSCGYRVWYSKLTKLL